MNVYELEFENLYHGDETKTVLAKDLADATVIASKLEKAAQENFGEESRLIRIQEIAKLTDVDAEINDMIEWNKEAQERFKEEEGKSQ